MNHSEIILYKTEDGSVKIDTIFQNETIWLTQKKMAELFDVQRPAITKHLKNIFESGELDEQVVSSILEHTADDGKKYKTRFYNLDTIIAFFKAHTSHTANHLATRLKLPKSTI